MSNEPGLLARWYRKLSPPWHHKVRPSTDEDLHPPVHDDYDGSSGSFFDLPAIAASVTAAATTAGVVAKAEIEKRAGIRQAEIEAETKRLETEAETERTRIREIAETERERLRQQWGRAPYESDGDW